MKAERRLQLLSALPSLPELRHLSLPSASLLPGVPWRLLTGLQHLTIRLVEGTELVSLAAIGTKLSSLNAVGITVTNISALEIVQRLARLPITRLSIYTPDASSLVALRSLPSLTDLDLSWGNSIQRDTAPDFTELPTLRTLKLSAYSDRAFHMARIALPGLTSLCVTGDRLNCIGPYQLPATLAHLRTSDFDIVVKAPTSLRSLAIVTRRPLSEPQRDFLGTLRALTTLLLPLPLTTDDVESFVLPMTRLEELGVVSVAGHLSTLSRLRTLRLECALADLGPPPSPHIRSLFVNAPQPIDRVGLRSLVRWSALRDLSLRGKWEEVNQQTWCDFAAALPQLMVMRMLYSSRKPSEATRTGASVAFVGKRLTIES